jgi:GNAT superfamily N-acetyltransferase
MHDLVAHEIRYVPAPEDPLARQARQVNDAAHEFRLSWELPAFQHYVAMAPDDQDKVVGVVEFNKSPNHIGERYGDIHITRIAVDADYRRNYIASALVTYIVQLGLEAGWSTISVQPYGDSSKAFFGNQGFVQSDREKRLRYFRYLDLG